MVRANSRPRWSNTTEPSPSTSGRGGEKPVRDFFNARPSTSASPMTQPRFITFEGIDGAGKSTQIPVFRQLLEKRGHTVWTTREPGGTTLGESLRELLLREPMAPLTEALLM